MVQWVDYEQRFKSENEKSNRFTEEELDEKLMYAKKLFDQTMPIVYTIDHLSKLMGVVPKEIHKISNSNSRFYYKEYEITKKTGGYREIKAPLPTLNLIQKWIFHNILQKTNASIFCKSYQKNLSLKDNAKFHRRQPNMLKLDISNFFDEVTWTSIVSVFHNLGYTSDLSKTLANMTTYSTGRYRKGIPQGACTSPILSNLVLKDFDDKIGNECIKNKIRYTRYADDMTFSGSFNTNALKKYVQNELLKYGFKLNADKTKRLNRNQRQIVTGIVVNEKMQAPRKYRKNLRLEIHFLLNNTDQHMEKKQLLTIDAKSNYLKSVLGKINFVLQINPKDEEFKQYKKRVYQIISSMSNVIG